MEMKWMKTFVVAAKHENFRKAAEELYLTQPAVTKHIHKLEESLNVQLFDRSEKSIKLTAAGHRYLPHATACLRQFDSGIEAFESWKQGYAQKLIIAVAPQIASSILPVLLRKFMDKYPDIEVLINVVTSYEVGEVISMGKADIGLTRIHIPQATISCDMVIDEPVVLVAPYKSQSEHEAYILQTYRVITHNHPGYWDGLLSEIKNFYPTVRTMKVNQMEVTKRFIEHDLGVSYIPLSMIKSELESNLFTIIQPNKIHLPISQTYVLSKTKTDEVEAFISFYKDEVESNT